MYFHTLINFDNENKYSIQFNNYSKEQIVEKALIPFVNGQVIAINTTKGKALVNLKSAQKIVIFKTEQKAKKEQGKTFIDLLRSKEFQDHNCTEEIIQEFSNQLTGDTRSDLQRKYSQETNSVFVIMKFGDKELDSAYEGVIDPIIQEFNLTPIRVDRVQNSGIITDQIIDYISTSKYVIADLTGERPNTYYEAGFAHALNKETILTIKRGEKIHFDLSSHRFIQWETEADLRKQLRDRFSNLTSNNDK